MKMQPQDPIYFPPCNVRTHYTMKDGIDKEFKYITIIHYRKETLPYLFCQGSIKDLLTKLLLKKAKNQEIFSRKEKYKISVGNSPIIAS